MDKTAIENNKGSSRLGAWLRSAGKDLRKNKSVYLLMIPGILYYIIFHYAPMYGIIISFVDYSPARGIFGSEWVGLRHFTNFFEGMYAWRVIRNTLIINIYSLIFVFPLGIILALLMNELRSVKFKKTIQTVTYLPHFISVVVVCGMVVDFTSSDGFITSIVNYLTGGEYNNLLYEVDMYRFIYLASAAWKNFGWNSIIYMAALAGLDMELYEAAEIDGAGKWKQLWHITIPGIMPTVVTMFILQVGQLMASGSEQTILLYNPVVYEKADLIASFIYRYGLEKSEFSYSSAVGLFNSIINIILVFSANKLSKKVNGSGIF